MTAPFLSWTDASGATQSFVFDHVEDEQWDGKAEATTSPVEIGADITDNVRPGLRTCMLKVFFTNEPMESNQWTNIVQVPVFITPPQKPTFENILGGILSVPTWQSNLQPRILAREAGGIIGSAIGGAAGNSQVGGLVGAAVGAAVGLLLNGRVVITDIPITAGPKPPPAPVTVNGKVWAPETPDDFVLKNVQLLETLRVTGQTIDVFGSKDSCIGSTPGIGGMALVGFSYHRGQEEGSGAAGVLQFQEIRVATTATVPAPKAAYPSAKKTVSKGAQNTTDADDSTNSTASAFGAGFKQGQADALGDAATP